MVPVARYYGYTPNRAGYIPCPLHPDKTASLKLYSGGRGWYCFGCKKGGTVIDFIAKLLNLTPLEAVKRLNTDFHLGLDLERRELTPQEVEAARQRQELSNTFEAFLAWRENTIIKLNNAYRTAHLLLKNGPGPDSLTEVQALAIREQSYLEWLADLLETGTMDEQISIFRVRKEVTALCNRICGQPSSLMPQKSGAA